MSKASGLLLIFAGLGMAAYAMPWDSGPRETASGVAASEAAGRPASISLSVAALPEARPPVAVAQATPPIIVPPKPQPAVRPTLARPVAPEVAAATAVVPVPVQAPTAIVVRQPEGGGMMRPLPPTQRMAAMPANRDGLARELQWELRRVGCYRGDINGSWGAESRRSMKAFTDRVNATLPIDQPDYILLALVRSHQEEVCGKGCPAGQALSDGQCLPNAIIARAAKKKSAPIAAAAPPRNGRPDAPAPASSSWSTTTTVAATPPSAPIDGRMALAGPQADQAGLSADERERAAGAAPQIAPAQEPVPAAVSDPRPPPRPVARPAKRRSNWGATYFQRREIPPG